MSSPFSRSLRALESERSRGWRTAAVGVLLEVLQRAGERGLREEPVRHRHGRGVAAYPVALDAHRIHDVLPVARAARERAVDVGHGRVLPGGGSGGGSGGGNPGQQQRAEVQCRNQAAREGVSVRSVAPAVLRGSYWETTVDGTRGGKPVRAICRFYPGGNRAELFYPGGSGAGWSGGG